MEGTPPEAAPEILTRLRSEQDEEGGEEAEVDHIYELTAELARNLIGSRHDQGFGDLAAPIDVLALQR